MRCDGSREDRCVDPLTSAGWREIRPGVQWYTWPPIVVSDWHLEQCNGGTVCHVPGRPR